MVEMTFALTAAGYICPNCGGSLLTTDDKGHQVLLGVPRRGMSDGALFCTHCEAVCVPRNTTQAASIGL